ncbi:MAG: TrkH family potassium uptake protein [Acidobacteriota bacterium]
MLAAAKLLPVATALLYGETRSLLAFLATAALTALIGAALMRVGRGADMRQLYRRDGILIVVGGWMLASLFGALPYWLSGTVDAPVDALFEAASGFTTTGATILLDIEAADRAVLLWRSFTQWLGGMGIIVLFVALLSELGPGARFLYKLEVPGPTAETLHPRVHDTASALWRIYLVLSVAQMLLLLAAGLSLYDALTHTFSTMSTGGFSPHGASIAAFESALVEWIVIAFMVLAGANFSLYIGLRQAGLRGSLFGGHALRTFLRDTELRVYLLLIGLFSLLIVLDLRRAGDEAMTTWAAVPELARDALFQVVSVLTTTGFATADFDTWPATSKALLAALLFVGGCAGSTAGGMKVMRLVVALRAAMREVQQIFRPSAVLAVFVARRAVPEAVVRSVMGFFILYIALWGTGTLLLAAGGNVDLISAATASITTLGNVGPGLAAVGPSQNFAFFFDWQKLLMVLLMWLGRLEVYVIVALFSPAFWRR